ncbi:MAG: hypothetical protein O2887_18460 [Bacteroidetes bacterium]|nr:hypothetical protein [Bacteroidota bacterium]MDA1122438.1 hypothetical protein [Bacteroidota bacterium]
MEYEYIWVETDHQSIATPATKHLAEGGFINFGFAVPDFNWSRWRKEHFEKGLRQGFLMLYFLFSEYMKMVLVIEQQENTRH